MSIRIATYNTLNPDHAVKYKIPEGIDAAGKSNYHDRANKILKNVLATNADHSFMQDMDPSVCPQFYNIIAGGLAVGGSWSFGMTRHSRTAKEGAMMHIFNTRVFEPADYNNQQLPDNNYVFKRTDEPGVENARASQAKDLRVTGSNRVVRFAHCSTAGVRDGAPPGTAQLDSDLEMMHKPAATYPVDVHVLVGDFNAGHDSPAFKKMAKQYKFDGDLLPTESASKQKHDYIWVKKDSKEAVLLRKVFVKIPHPEASNHQPVVNELFFGSSILEKYKVVEDMNVVKQPDGQWKILEALLKDKTLLSGTGDGIRALRDAFKSKLKSLGTEIQQRALFFFDDTIDRLSYKDPVKLRPHLIKGLPTASTTTAVGGVFKNLVFKDFKATCIQDDSMKKTVSAALGVVLAETIDAQIANPKIDFEVYLRAGMLRMLDKLTLTTHEKRSVLNELKDSWYKSVDKLEPNTLKVGAKSLSGRVGTSLPPGTPKYCCFLNMFFAIGRFFKRLFKCK